MRANKTALNVFLSIDEIENGNGECIQETTTRPKSRKQPKDTNGSSIQRENPLPRCVFQLTPRLNMLFKSQLDLIVLRFLPIKRNKYTGHWCYL